jgi:flagellar FliL protein
MADEPREEENEPGEEGGQPEGAGGRPRVTPKTALILALPVLLLAGGGYFAVQAFGLPLVGEPAEQSPARHYIALPEMVVNLSSGDEREKYLKLKVSLETSSEKTAKALKPVMPRVLDTFQLYLREMRASDLEGSAGVFRLKEELQRRINTEIHPHKVERVLFKEIIVQ